MPCTHVRFSFDTGACVVLGREGRSTKEGSAGVDVECNRR